MDNSQLSVSLFDLVVIGILFDPQNLVVVLALALLELELGVADFLCDTRFLRVAFGNGLQLLNCLLPVTGLSQGLGLRLASLGVAGIKLQCTLTVLDCLLPFLELHMLLDTMTSDSSRLKHTLV